MTNEILQAGTVDRFEGDFALIELPNKNIITVKRILLDTNIVEGDRISRDKQGIWRKDVQATDDTRRRIRKLMDDLFE